MSDWAVRPIAAARGDDLSDTAAQIFPRDREQAAIAQLVVDQEIRHVSPAHALKNDLLLHQLVAYRPCPGALDEIIIARRRMPRRVANDALHAIAHLLRRDPIRDRKRQKVRRDD